MKELRLVARLRNNRLMELREAECMSAREVAKASGVSYESYLALEAMRRQPWGKCGGFGKPRWLPSAVAIAGYWKQPVEFLFPDSVRDLVKAQTERRLDAEEVFALGQEHQRALSAPLVESVEIELSDRIGAALAVLTAKERRVIELRFGLTGNEHTLVDTGAQLQNAHTNRAGITPERIRQIEARALRKLRRDSRLKAVATP